MNKHREAIGTAEIDLIEALRKKGDPNSRLFEGKFTYWLGDGAVHVLVTSDGGAIIGETKIAIRKIKDQEKANIT